MTYPPQPGAQPPMGQVDHPRGQTLLIVSIVALLCCAPVNIWTLVVANGIMKAPGGYNVSKVNTARIIAIVSLALWAVGLVISFVSGSFNALLYARS